jgi:regulator of sigma E protease
MIISILALIVVLGILIFIHELGHFVVAKLSGVGVEKFSLGFGPRIFWFTRGETEYRLSLLPFGGYVKMMGESPDEEVPEEDKLKSFSHKPISRRAAIVAAGSFMNIVLALVLFPLIFMVGISVPAHLEMPPVVGYVTPDSPAHTVGIKKGDIIESVNGRPVGKWEDLVIAVALEPERDMVFKLRRGTETFEATVIDTDEPMGLYAPMSAIVGEVSGGAPAEEAGLKAGDRILDIDGREIDHWAALRDAIKDSPEERDFLVERGELLYHYHIKPRFDETDEVVRVFRGRKERSQQGRLGECASFQGRKGAHRRRVLDKGPRRACNDSTGRGTGRPERARGAFEPHGVFKPSAGDNKPLPHTGARRRAPHVLRDRIRKGQAR